MLFSSVTFLFFFLPLVLAGLLVLPQKWRVAFLLVLSLLFYAWGEPGAIWLMILSILIAYFFGRLMEWSPRHKRLWLVLSTAVLLLMLAYFKYAGMFFPSIKTVLPAGISFYTFQAIGYSVDIYRGNLKAEKQVVPFGAFISLFPQLIAGPIERYGDIQPQFSGLKLSWEGLSEGARLFTIGLSKKLLLANPMGQLWERLSATPLENGITGNWLALLAFGFQIYFDFSGYSDMARGLGRMMNISFSKNFNYPFTATSVTDFWRRWHITLSIWFREYVYIPLGGNRKGLMRQLFNLLVVWALTGLWHGANWNFVLWGLFYAALLMMEKLFLLKWYKSLPSPLRFVPRLVTLFFVTVGWAIFALTDFSRMATMLSAMFTGALKPGALAGAGFVSYLPMLLACVLASRHWKIKLPAWLDNVLLLVLLLFCVSALVTQGYNPFLYFRF